MKSFGHDGNNEPFLGVGADDLHKNRHDEAFRREVEKAITEADDPRTDWVSDQTAKNLSDARRKVWREKLKRHLIRNVSQHAP